MLIYFGPGLDKTKFFDAESGEMACFSLNWTVSCGQIFTLMFEGYFS